MVYGFLQFSQRFMAAYPDYFISPLRINGSAIESIFSVLKFTAGGNLYASNYGSFRGRVITGREVITNSNSERGYRDDMILMSGSITSSSGGSRMSYSVRLVYDPFGLSKSQPVYYWWSPRKQCMHHYSIIGRIPVCQTCPTGANVEHLTKSVV